MNELEEKEKRLGEFKLLIDEINELIDVLGTHEIDNIATIAYNKVVLLSILFYKKNMKFYSSSIYNFIMKYFLNVIHDGVNMLGDYAENEYCNLDSKYIEMYNKTVYKIKYFDVDKDIVEAIKGSIPNILELGVSKKTIDTLIDYSNEELCNFGSNTIIPEFKELYKDNDNGKKYHK